MRDNLNTIVQLTNQEYAHRQSLASNKVTLDGIPARIIGLRMKYAVIHTLDESRQVEFSWQAVERIIKNNEGRFYS